MSTTESKNITITIPKECSEQDVLFKLNKRAPPNREEKFRSFLLPLVGAHLRIGDKNCTLSSFYDILREKGLSSTMPAIVSFNPLNIACVDWSPCCYGGPAVWYFTWKGSTCSIVGKNYSGVIYFRVHDLTPTVAEKILEELTQELLARWINPVPTNVLTVYTAQKSYNGFTWTPLCTRLHREIDTVYMNEDTKTKLITQLRKFYDSSDLYDRYGVTWKRVHILYGPPGCGKTSTVIALASLFKKDIAKLTISPAMTSEQLELLFQTVKDNSFLLLEDVDALFTGRQSNYTFDFSTMLNCMDGVATKRGLVVFMTTNKIDDLDAAFVRPGRVDLAIKFDYPSRTDLKAALNKFGSQYAHEHEEFLGENSTITIAELQKHLFERIMDENPSIL